MSGNYTIGELARRASVPASTVRYYERRGLLAADGRTEANYRVFSERSLERLRFIKAAQASGFTLSDVSRLLAVVRGGHEPCGQVQDLIEERLGRLDRTIEELQGARVMLREALMECRDASRADPCHVVEELGERPEQDLRGGNS